MLLVNNRRTSIYKHAEDTALISKCSPCSALHHILLDHFNPLPFLYSIILVLEKEMTFFLIRVF